MSKHNKNSGTFRERVLLLRKCRLSAVIRSPSTSGQHPKAAILIGHAFMIHTSKGWNADKSYASTPSVTTWVSSNRPAPKTRPRSTRHRRDFHCSGWRSAEGAHMAGDCTNCLAILPPSALLSALLKRSRALCCR